jgi:uncharacterized PurR-regulated membrane protein YhhQ (DUF165 family)
MAFKKDYGGKCMRIFFYVISIIIANVITAKFAPMHIGLLIIPYGTFLIGATFVLRDLVQTKHGRKRTYLVIVMALLWSAISSYMLGDTLWIVFASALSFALSEFTDTEIFTRLKKSFYKRVLFSGVIGGTIDSTIFVIIGLSPLGANFLGWELVPYAILGQVIIKSFMQVIGIYILKLLNQNKQNNLNNTEGFL